MDTFATLVADYLDTLALKRRSRHTIAAYTQSLRMFQRHITANAPDKADDPASITHRGVLRFLASLQDAGYAPSTVAKRFADVRLFFRWLVAEGEIPRNPADKVETPKREEPPVRLVETDAVKALLSLDWNTPFMTARNRALILALLDLGVRVSELCAMRVEDVDLAHTRVAVRGAKGSGVRVLPFGKSAAVALRRYLRARKRSPHAGSPFLWIGLQGALRSMSVYRMLERASDAAGVPRAHPHAWRHTFAHRFRMNGGGDGDLQYLGGWTSPAMLQRYGAAGRAERAQEAHARFSPADHL